MSTQHEIEQRLQQYFTPDHLMVVDVSAAHRGHAAALANPGKGHFQVHIVATMFETLSQVQRHQAVYRALGDLMATSIHAVSITAFTPSEQRQQHSDA